MQFVKTVLCSSALMAFLAASSPASAQWRTEQLRGDFAITGTTACLNSPAKAPPAFPVYSPPAGFDSLLRPNDPSSIVLFSLSFNGVSTFNGDGTGTTVARTVSVNVPGSPQAADFTIPFKYSLAADRTLTIVQDPALVTFVAGVRAGPPQQQISISGTPALIGRVSSDGKSITFGSFEPGVETATRVFPPVPNPVESVRICHRAFAGIRIGKTPGAFGNEGDD